MSSSNCAKKDDNLGYVEDWKKIGYLGSWLDEQEKMFELNNIDDDQEKIAHIIKNIDVKYWSKLENYFKYNQQDQLTYDTMRSVLFKKVERVYDPRMKKYDKIVDGLIDKFTIPNIDLENLTTWLKRLRSQCNGEAKDEYLITKIFNRVVDNQKEAVFRRLTREITEDINLYESRIKANGTKPGKQGTKILNQKKAIRDTLKLFMEP